MNTRLVYLRKHCLHYTQAELAEKIGLKQNAISYMEKSGSTITEQNIKSICREFGVNESWLRFGTGDIFSDNIPDSDERSLKSTSGRIKCLRKKILNYTQDEFAQKINISRANLSSIETGRIAVTDRVITDICREFSINESWLRFGTGEIRLPESVPENDKELIKDVIYALCNMDEDDLKLVIDIIKRLTKYKELPD